MDSKETKIKEVTINKDNRVIIIIKGGYQGYNNGYTNKNPY